MNSRLYHVWRIQEYASRACLVHVFDFYRISLKITNIENMLGALTRATFPTRAWESGFQNVAVANDFLQNSHSRSNMLLRVAIKPLRNA